MSYFSTCLTEGCDSPMTMLINFNGMSKWFCDPCAQKYLGSTKAFFAIVDIERRAPGPRPECNPVEEDGGIHFG